MNRSSENMLEDKVVAVSAANKTQNKKAKKAATSVSIDTKDKKSGDNATKVTKSANSSSKSKGGSAKAAKTAGASKKETTKKKSSSKKQEQTSEPSSKTPQVMKLVQPTEMINPVIVAGKSSIPKALRGVEPLSRMLRREARQLDSAITGELVTVNLTAVAIDESAVEILRRFNACDCAICVEELSRLTAEQVTARFVKLKPQDAELGSDKLEELKAPVKKQVIQQMIRIVIKNPKRSFHG